MKMICLVLFLILLICVPCISSNRYVSTTGSNKAAGSVDAPWRTITHGCVRIVAGDTLFIRGGPYHEYDIDVIHSGKSESLIVVKSYPGESAIIRCDSLHTAFTFGQRRAIEYVNIENIVVKFPRLAGFLFANANYSINNCTIKNCRVDSLVQSDNSGGIIFGTTCHFVKAVNDTIVGNRTNNQNYACIFIHSADGSITIDGCDLSGSYYGINYKYPSNATHMGIIINNFLHDNVGGGANINSDRVLFKNNVVINNTWNGITYWGDPGSRGGSYSRIEHNTVYNSRYTVTLAKGGGVSTYPPSVYGATSDTLVNNLFIGSHGELGSFCIWGAVISGCSHKTISDYNNYYNTATTNVIKEYSLFYTLAAWKIKYPTMDQHSIDTRPIFANYSKTMREIDDFELIGRGKNAGLGGSDMGADVLLVSRKKAQITSATRIKCFKGKTLSYQLTASKRASKFTSTPLPLPNNLFLDTLSGKITGTPTDRGIFKIIIRVWNVNGISPPESLFVEVSGL